jgi:hypothetical protein
MVAYFFGLSALASAFVSCFSSSAGFDSATASTATAKPSRINPAPFLSETSIMSPNLTGPPQLNAVNALIFKVCLRLPNDFLKKAAS